MFIILQSLLSVLYNSLKIFKFVFVINNFLVQKAYFIAVVFIALYFIDYRVFYKC